MNRRCYQLIFNARRGQIMAVSEAGSRQGKSQPGESSAPAAVLAWAVGASLLLGGASPVAAQIVAYKDAPGNQRATVLRSGNGVPIVNVQTPSAAGVSRNTYSQFDVGGEGAVLNNSRTGAVTEVAGKVGANPWMAKGTARIIVNEVVSANASRLRGTVEVGGDRAEVVIANPSGIEVDGARFSNTSRATLTTGVPVHQDGKLHGYTVKQGTITVQSGGLDASQTDYTAILARALKVNGAIHAKELHVITGANAISADHKTVTPIAGTGAPPAVAVDVSELGGMYAGKIRLVGTEAGVGVRNAGKIVASAGEVVISSEGFIVNTGTIASSNQIQLAQRDTFTNTGTLQSAGAIKIAGRSHLYNSGRIQAGTDVHLETTGTDSDITHTDTAFLLAGLVSQEEGDVWGDTGSIDMGATGNVIASGKTMAAQSITASGGAIGTWGGELSAPLVMLYALPNPRRVRSRRTDPTATEDTQDNRVLEPGDINLTNAILTAHAKLVAQTDASLITDGADIAAPQMELGAADISNRLGRIRQLGDTALQLFVSGHIDNTGGTLVGRGDVRVRAGTLGNDQGRLLAAQVLRLDIGALANARGVLHGDLGLQAHAVSLSNAGLVDGAVQVDTQLRNDGTIQGSANASHIHNTGKIDGIATATESLENDGTVTGLAKAGTHLTNRGTLGDVATATLALRNSGTIAANASAGEVSNSGTIAGWVRSGATLDNSGTIASSATADTQLSNSGAIAGEAKAGTSLDNSGRIDGAAIARTGLTNSGVIAGFAQSGCRPGQ
ncbi:MAG: filamentous hemagglutinin N-terminal domain-containing protein [Burkholderiales bacterium]|nr:filamentous hemagglutinin N-terminal domain-containing protein [Burkholderiales bacterium]